MDAGLVLVVALALTFAFTNGVQDAANSIATLVATRGGRPGPALAVATAGVLVGPLLLGSAVADTVAGIVQVPSDEMVEVVTAALLAALAWNLGAWYRGLPSSSSHALVGGLAGAGVASAGLDAVNWGSFDGWRPGGVGAVLVALALSPLIGAGVALLALRLVRRALRRASRRATRPLRGAQWITSGLLSIGQGANDAQKTVGALAAVLLAHGTTTSLQAPFWAVAGAAVAMAAGTALGGWRLVRTIGRRIYDLRPLDGLASQTGSAAIILVASAAGAPVSSTHVVASSVVGVGGGRRRWGRVRWAVVGEMGIAWATTLPATAALAAAALSLWRWLA
ncbi:MAG TPA: inorganic phosphate transporter [Gaiellaceae bacterium]|nr:inorganic phosphate transporter [Gaiellaceae bacterium]